MGQIFCQVTLPARSLLPEDNAINTFSFTGVAPVEDQAGIALDRLRDFYNEAAGTATQPIKNYFAPTHNPGNMRIKVYDYDDPEPRTPILDESLGVTSPSPVATQNLPSEVALCTSFSAPPQSGEPQARRRGRIFLGPLNTGAGAGNNDQYSRPVGAFITTVVQACKELSSEAPIGAQWAVYSRRNQSFVLVDRGWVDNAWDTQRRRGVNRTARNAWEREI